MKNALKMNLKDEMRKEKPIPASEKEKLQDLSDALYLFMKELEYFLKDEYRTIGLERGICSWIVL